MIPRTQENRPQKSLFPNLDLENEYIHMMETPIGDYTIKLEVEVNQNLRIMLKDM